MKRNFIISALAIASVAGVLPVSAQAESVNGITSSVHKLQEGQWEAVQTSGGDSSSSQTVSGVAYKHDVMYINDIAFTDFNSTSDSGSNKYYYNYIESLYAQGIPVDIKFLARVGQTRRSTGSSGSYSDYTFSTPLFNSATVGYDSLANNKQVETFLVHFKVNLTQDLTCYAKREYNSDTSTDTRTYYGVKLKPFEMGISGIIDEMSGVTIEQASSIVQSYVNSMEATNSTNNSSIQSTLQSMLGDKITVNVGALGVVPATDTSKGSLTGNISITDSKGQSSQVGINKVIPRLDQTALTAKNRIESALGSLKVTNATTQDDILTDLRSRVDVGSVNLGVSNFQKTLATESTQGRVTCTVSVSDSSSSYQVQVNSAITRLPQSLDSIYEQASNVISRFQATNNTTEKDILDLITIKNDSVTANVANFGVVPATESSRGHLTGKVVLSEGSYSKEIDLSGCTIDYLPQSLETAKSRVEKVLSRYTLENTTTNQDIKDLVDSVVDTNEFNTSASITVTKPATTDFQGSADIVVRITNKVTGASEEVSNTYKVATDPVYQTEEQLKNRVLNYLLLYKPTNSTEPDDIIKALDSDGVRLNPSISIKYGDTPETGAFTKVKATDVVSGDITGKLYIGSGQVVDFTGENKLIISPEPSYQTPMTLKDKILNYLPTLVLPSSADDSDLVDDLSKLVTNSSLKLEVQGYNKTPSTSVTTGHITGGLVISDSATKEVINDISVPLGLDKTNQSLTEAETAIKDAIADFKPSNSTTKDDLIDFIQGVVTNPNIGITIDDSAFDKIIASANKDGSIEADITISNGGNNTSISTGVITIDRLGDYQTESELLDSLNLAFDSFEATNSTVDSDLLDYLKPCVTNSDFELSVENFHKSLATSRNDGYVNADIVVSNKKLDTSSKLNTGDLVINKRIEYQTEADIALDIKDSLADFKPTNSTTKENLLEHISKGVSNKFEVSIFDDAFNKVLATSRNDGSVEATVVIKNLESSKTTPTNTGILVIDKNPQYQTESELIEDVNNAISSLVPSNNLTKEDIIEIVSSVVTNGSNVDFGVDTEDFNKVFSTIYDEGKITGTVIVGGIEFPIDLVIPKKPSSGSGGSSSSGGGSDSDSSSSSDVTDGSQIVEKPVTSASFSLLGIERSGIPSTVNTLQDNEQITESVIDGVDSDVYAVAIPYKEDNAELSSTDVNGNLKLLYKDTSCVGVVLESDSEYTDSTVVSIASNMKAEDLKAYSYNKDINLYTESSPDLQSDGEVLKLRGTGKNKYILAVDSLDTNLVAEQGWNYKENSDNWYYVQNEDCKDGWMLDSTDNNWYHCNGDSKKMNTGWLQDKDSNWYYLNPISDGTRGSVKTGWVQDNNSWYYMNTVSDGTKGAMKTGWVKDADSWYYLDSSGKMVTGSQEIDGTKYNFDDSGKMI